MISHELVMARVEELIADRTDLVPIQVLENCQFDGKPAPAGTVIEVSRGLAELLIALNPQQFKRMDGPTLDKAVKQPGENKCPAR